MIPYRLAPAVTRRWRLRALRRARVTRWTLGMAAVLWLTMQFSLAAYACALPLSSLPMAGPGTMTVMAMDGIHPDGIGPAAQVLCTMHCTSAAPDAPDVRPMTVPPTTLPALLPVPPILARPGTVRPAMVNRLQTGPPSSPHLLFCSLQI